MTKADKFQIRIESILGGQSPTTHFSRADQFLASLGIDPAQPVADSGNNSLTYLASGLLRPVPTEKFSGTTVNNSPLWIITHPKGSNAAGSGQYDTRARLHVAAP